VRTVVLIGPPAAGKSTVGPFLAASLGTNFVDVDEVGHPYYEASAQPLESFVAMIDREGYTSAHRWWQPARVAAGAGVVLDHPGAVIAFGAGHSHFEDVSSFDSIRRTLGGCTVVLMLPDADPTRSLDILRARCLATKGHDWTRDGHDYLSEWIASEQNRALADIVVYSGDLTPQRYADTIASGIRRVASDE
jgi:Shikimate kinase